MTHTSDNGRTEKSVLLFFYRYVLMMSLTVGTMFLFYLYLVHLQF